MRRILLIHPGAMGDLIQALPAFDRIRTHFADDHLTLLVGDPLVTLSRSWGIFDAVLSFDLRTAYRGSWLGRGRLLFDLLRVLRGGRYDLVATFKAAPIYAILARCTGAGVRVGLSRGTAAAFLTESIPLSLDDHQEDRFLGVARALGAVEGRAGTARWPNDSTALASLTAEQRTFLIGVAPSGGNAKGELGTRRWPAARFAELCARLLAEHAEAHVVVLGASSDRESADRIVQSLPPGRATSLAGKTSVPAARDVIAACRVFVTNDSGLMHVGGSTTTPLVAIFGPTSPATICPRRAGVTAIWHPARPTPCHDSRTGEYQPCIQPCCIDRCSVDEVLMQVNAALAGTSARV